MLDHAAEKAKVWIKGHSVDVITTAFSVCKFPLFLGRG